MSALEFGSESERLSRVDATSVVVASVLGSFAFGIVMSLTMGDVLFAAIPAMYGLGGVDPTTGTLLGWAIHVSHGTVLGLVFGGAFSVAVPLGDDTRRWAVAGLAYGAALWLVLATFVMPVWVGAVTASSPPVPDVRPWSLVGHLLYGVYLGALIPIYRRY
ncbi:uncharacterized protein Nmlp_3559 [Natronomonas moolapensis 8.8.11]|uniref:Histidine kinase n=1 Tax=Natronomonas moolapensis (strain DSM 18674 / CECT 7526 / JCM 14361 / 8.8.11) TaxID=268739 RepID=M1XTE4_NATM8|nr:hypothetical protein [Natronomonas moolapensis]CCQ37683.1 uncharacterized protein Nmlp_3559 [Natronomonas moolapensis 8.8.11]